MSRPPVGWLYSGLQVMHPGEMASAHRHSASALRFIMEGAGAYTVVDGHKMTLGAQRLRADAERHLARARRRGDGTPCIWQDGLDIPFVNALEANFYEVHPDLQQAVTYPVDDMTTTWGNARPDAGRRRLGQGLFAAPQVRWEPTYEALPRYAKVHRRLAL